MKSLILSIVFILGSISVSFAWMNIDYGVVSLDVEEWCLMNAPRTNFAQCYQAQMQDLDTIESWTTLPNSDLVIVTTDCWNQHYPDFQLVNVCIRKDMSRIN